jgi:hypothetical protein
MGQGRIQQCSLVDVGQDRMISLSLTYPCRPPRHQSQHSSATQMTAERKEPAGEGWRRREIEGEREGEEEGRVMVRARRGTIAG